MNLTHPSPNFGERRGRGRVELVVLHYTAMPSCAEALERLCDPLAEVSAHYLIDADGSESRHLTNNAEFETFTRLSRRAGARAGQSVMRR